MCAAAPLAALLAVVMLASCAALLPRPSTDSLPAHVTFLSEPPGATVRINGTALDGITPLEHVALEPGFVAIEMQLDGFDPAKRQQTLEPDEATYVHLVLLAQPTPSPTPTLSPTATPSPRLPQQPRINIHSQPPGARVKLDGTLLPGTTPLLGLEIAAGTYTLELSAPGFETVKLQRTWGVDASDTVQVALVKSPARITFTSTPPGATVTVNGVTLEGVTPIDNALLPAEATDIEMTLTGHVTQKARRVWQPNMIDYIDLELEPAPARVTFRSEPAGAEVSVNGRVLGRTTIEAAELIAGKARITYTLADHEMVVVEREWKPGDIDEVTVVLFGAPGRVQFQSQPAWDRLAIDGEPVEVTPGAWMEMSEGAHTLHAWRGEEVAQAEFTVQPGADTTVGLEWRRRRIDLAQYSLFPAAEVNLGDAKYGADNPPRRAPVEAFAMLRTEVTVAQYRQCVDAGSCPEPGRELQCNWGEAGRDNHPINCVRATDAEAYARWKSESTGVLHRLPTCREWERAARASGGIYPWGDTPPAGRCNSCDAKCPFPRLRDDSFDDGWKETAPAALLDRCVGEAGVFDLIGNVSEWCSGESAGTFEVRGGSWGQAGPFLESAFATRRSSDDRDVTVGFRLIVPQPDWR